MIQSSRLSIHRTRLRQHVPNRPSNRPCESPCEYHTPENEEKIRDFSNFQFHPSKTRRRNQRSPKPKSTKGSLKTCSPFPFTWRATLNPSESTPRYSYCPYVTNQSPTAYSLSPSRSSTTTSLVVSTDPTEPEAATKGTLTLYLPSPSTYVTFSPVPVLIR